MDRKDLSGEEDEEEDVEGDIEEENIHLTSIDFHLCLYLTFKLGSRNEIPRTLNNFIYGHIDRHDS